MMTSKCDGPLNRGKPLTCDSRHLMSFHILKFILGILFDALNRFLKNFVTIYDRNRLT